MILTTRATVGAIGDAAAARVGSISLASVASASSRSSEGAGATSASSTPVHGETKLLFYRSKHQTTGVLTCLDEYRWLAYDLGIAQVLHVSEAVGPDDCSRSAQRGDTSK